MRGEAEQCVIERVDDGEKEKKKKRRSSRRAKQNAFSTSSASCSSISGINWEASTCLKNCRIDNDIAGPLNDLSPTEDELTSAVNVSSSSLPAMHMTEYEDILESQISKGPHLSSNCVVISKSRSQLEPGVILDSQISENQHVSSNGNGSVIPKLCPQLIACHGPYTHNGLSPLHQVGGHPQRKYFPPHWSLEVVNKAVQKGDVFKAVFRINAHNKLEAYCKIDGVPIDVLINGISSQNRAVEGDIVAVKVDPVTLWTKMRGSMEVSYNSSTLKDGNFSTEDSEIELHNCKGKCKRDGESECTHACSHFSSKEASNEGGSFLDKGNNLDEPLTSADQVDGYCLSNALRNLCHMIGSFPSKRPTGRVVSIIERSPRRDTVVGFLNVKQLVTCREDQIEVKKTNSVSSFSDQEFIQLTPTDPRLPKMMVSVRYLPGMIKKRLEKGDATVERELVGGRIEDWEEESSIPLARILHVLGRGGEIESHINAILFENAIRPCEFSPDLLSCIPQGTWEVPLSEYQERRDLRNICIFTIDPPTATDLDDALSVERLGDNIFRVGVHISDVSYFVLPDTTLDREAQKRSTSVYLVDRKVPMLPPLLSEDIGSLNPGENRLAFSMIFDIDHTGVVIDRWIGRTVICSCCKLSYEHAQWIIDGFSDEDSSKAWKNVYPQLHGQCQWNDVTRSIKSLNDISKSLRNNRFKNGALRLETPKYDSKSYDSMSYDSMLCERNDSNFLVEEFMLLANRTAAEVISRGFPASALLRRQLEPNIRRLRDFEAFCLKYSLELDASSSGQFNQSLERLKLKLKNDSVLFDILSSHASRTMQLATYFCSGEFEDSVKDWYHYALAFPLYTHFTSPLRRYSDIIVHRILASTVEAEKALKQQSPFKNIPRIEEITGKCFTGLLFDKSDAESLEMGKALSAAALRYRLPGTEALAVIAAYCNERKLASQHAKDACDKLYMWAMVKKNEFLITNARVLGLGPRFMSVYVHKLAIERRIYYDEVEGLSVEWHDVTSSLVLSLWANKRPIKRASPSKWRALEEVAVVVSPCDLNYENGTIEGSFRMFGPTQVEYTDAKYIDFETEIEPPVFPLTIHLLSTIPVVIHAVGGDDGPIDISAKLFTSSYLR